MVDKCMLLARTASNPQQRDELIDAALHLLRTASSCDNALPDLPSAPKPVTTIAMGPSIHPH
jgi:hypothetical protein